MNIELILFWAIALGLVAFVAWGYSEISLKKYSQIDQWLTKYPGLYERQTNELHLKVANFQYYKIKKQIKLYELRLLSDEPVETAKNRVLNYFNNTNKKQ